MRIVRTKLTISNDKTKRTAMTPLVKELTGIVQTDSTEDENKLITDYLTEKYSWYFS